MERHTNMTESSTLDDSYLAYDLVLYNGRDRGSIIPVRKYIRKRSMSPKLVADINKVLSQALKATGLLVGENEGAFLDLDKEWVESHRGNERTAMMLANEPLFDTSKILILKNKTAHDIARVIMCDLAETDYWDYQFGGDIKDATNLPYHLFSTIDDTIDNSNLKVPIDSKVYVDGRGSNLFVYRGRPSNQNIIDGHSLIFAGNNVWSTDSAIISYESFQFDDYKNRIETFPLPKKEKPNRYFSREKDGAKESPEAFGRTQKETKLRLALMLAFRHSA